MLAVMAMLMTTSVVTAQNYGIVFGALEVNEVNAADIFGNGTASYDLEQNTLVLQDNFNYHLSRGFVTINTGRDFRIRLEGDAKIYAAVVSDDAIIVEADDNFTLSFTANISGSALKCKSLTVMPKVYLDLLSRNSQSDMYALDCESLTVNNAVLYAEVTTAQLAVATQQMTLNECWLKKPHGGFVSAINGGICFGDGIPAKLVRIVTEGYGVDELDEPAQNVSVEKVFKNGQVIIIKDGKQYDMTGRALN